MSIMFIAFHGGCRGICGSDASPRARGRARPSRLPGTLGRAPRAAARHPDGSGAAAAAQLPRLLAPDCSCPDYADPCKHFAGVYYRLAGRLDGDPFLLFELRGLSRERLHRALSATPLGKAPPSRSRRTSHRRRPSSPAHRPRRRSRITASSGKAGNACRARSNRPLPPRCRPS